MDASDFDLSVWGVTDVGRTRTGNQDTFIALSIPPEPEGPTRLGPEHDFDGANGPGGAPLSVGPQGALLAVADGMGGTSGGDVASRLAVDAVADSLERAALESLGEASASPATLLRDAVAEAHARIQAFAADQPWLQGMGTTLTAAVVSHGRLAVAQVGDSRAYLLRGERIIQLTRDQTWVQEMIDAGTLTPEQARTSPRRNLLLQALGSTSGLSVPVAEEPLRPGDILLLCSDGLCGILTDARILRIVLDAPTLRDACRELVKEANDAGGPDNITVLLAEPRARPGDHAT